MRQNSPGELLSDGDPHLLPSIRIVLPHFDVAHRTDSEWPFVNDAVYKGIRLLTVAELLGEQPEVLVILQSAALRLQTDARNRLFVIHHHAAIDELAGAVINSAWLLKV